MAAAYPGTRLYREARENGWLRAVDGTGLVSANGLQISSLEYPSLSHGEIFDAVADFYRRFYFRPRKIAELSYEMLISWEMMRRRLREAVEFFRFLRERSDAPTG